MKKSSIAAVSCAFFMFALLSAIPVSAAPGVAVVNLQKVLEKSSVGLAAKKKMEKKMKEFKADLDKEKKGVLALQEEMKKKVSVWSEEKKKEKVLELQRKKRDFKVKQEDANIEMRTLQEKYLAPIMKKLEGIVKEVAAEKGVSVIMPNTAVLYFDKTVDMTETITAALNAKMK
ncbi:MAG: OmpH family outer membrane protein [Candidatus Electrothrix sp. AR4]|nr:OmpH family outer membrane protein [Candidatus Electrothrix sp. AR4]